MTSKYGLMSLTKKELWKAAGSRLDDAIEKQRRRPFTELMALVDQDEGGHIEIDGVKMFVSCWAKKVESEKGSVTTGNYKDSHLSPTPFATLLRGLTAHECMRYA